MKLETAILNNWPDITENLRGRAKSRVTAPYQPHYNCTYYYSKDKVKIQ